jgi:hypothetical protein
MAKKFSERSGPDLEIWSDKEPVSQIPGYTLANMEI